MLKVETIDGISHNKFPEPEGTVVKVIEHNKRHNRLTVLTRVDELGEGSGEAPVESSPIDPAAFSVSELRSALSDDDYDWNEAALRGLLEAERSGENRSTAISSIEEALERQ